MSLQILHKKIRASKASYVKFFTVIVQNQGIFTAKLFLLVVFNEIPIIIEDECGKSKVLVMSVRVNVAIDCRICFTSSFASKKCII